MTPLAPQIRSISSENAADEYGIDDLSREISAGIAAAVHSANKVEIDDWGFIIVDARNAFNELNRYTMLWMLRHI